MTGAVLRTDGGARGNPGPAGAGFVIEREGETICAGGRFLGETTNNVAEYEALLWGLENARQLGIDEITVLSDSELLVRQVNGVYRVRNEGLKPLFKKVRALLDTFGSWSVRHVRREENSAADELANRAMDERGIVGDPVCGPDGGPGQTRLF